MIRTVAYLIIIIVALLIPEKGTDVGKIIPAELIMIYKEGEQVVVVTDTEDVGKGSTVAEAVENMKTNALGVIFLDTVDYLLRPQDAAELESDITEYMKPGVRIYEAEKGTDLVWAARYLNVHKKDI